MRIIITNRRVAATLLGLAAILTIGCNDTPGPAEPTVGDLKITVATTGATVDLDNNGYTLTIDGGTPLTLSSNAAVTIPALASGTHLVLLGDLAPNCSVMNGTNPRSIEVGRQSGTPASVPFFVTCKPKTGSIRVSTVTVGPDADANGYRVNVAGRVGDIAPSGTREFFDIREGSYQAFLTDLAENCAVVGANPLSVNVSFGVTVVADFSIQCVKAATLVITTSTTGVELDPNGYLLELHRDGANTYTTASAPVNGTTTVTGLLPGIYVLTMSGVMLNCTVAASSPRTVTVNVESANGVTLVVSCEAPTQLAFVRGTGNNAEIYSFNSNGSGITNLTDSPVADLDPEWSPDGSKIAFASDRNADREIYVMNANGTSPVRLTNSAGADSRPAWSPNGERIAFMSERDGNPEMYVMNADGTNPVRLTSRVGYDGDPTWSPDGARLAFASDQGGNSGIWIMNADGSGVVRLTTNGFRDRQPAWSPDGKTIAFAREVSTTANALFIIDVDGSNLARLTENLYIAGDPAWSPDGRKIAFGGLATYDFYYSFEPELMFVGIDGTRYSAPLPGGPATSNPAWRPR